MSGFQDFKFWLIGQTGLAKDALHIYIGLLLFLGSAALFRWPLKSWKPWCVAALGALAGEAWDLRDSVVFKTPIVLSANFHDIWNTLFWPTALFLLARYTNILRR